MDAGRRIEQLIESLNIQKKDFAKSIGIKPAALSLYLHGDRKVSLELLQTIVDTYGLNPSYFFDETSESPNQEYDPDAIEILALLDRPDMHDLKMLFKKTGKLSQEDKEQIARILKATLPQDEGE